jgi:hypothetical protein
MTDISVDLNTNYNESILGITNTVQSIVISPQLNGGKDPTFTKVLTLNPPCLNLFPIYGS